MSRSLYAFTLFVLMTPPIQACSQVSKEVSRRPERLQVDSVYQSGRSGIRTTTQIIVRDSTSWRTWWDRIVSDYVVMPALPAVDFDKETVIVVGSGTTRYNGFSVSIDSVIVGYGQLLVYVTDAGPGTTCVAGMSSNQPVVVVRVPRHDEPARFVTRVIRSECK